MSSVIKITEIVENDFELVGEMLVKVYSKLPGMPSISQQPEYYNRLKDVGLRVSNSHIHIFVAKSENGEIMGSVDFIDDMKHYAASGGTAGSIENACGVRLLCVDSSFQGRGVGKLLMEYCVAKGRELGKMKVILHTTKAMETAWGMYERMGFQRYPDIDFDQKGLLVFGFELCL